MNSGGSRQRFTTGSLRGFPIRTSPDHSSFTNSPGLIAGYNVLHRLLVPRHPPIALSSLSKNSTTKMLASTVKFSTHERNPTPSTPQGHQTPDRTKNHNRPFRTQQCAHNHHQPPDTSHSAPRKARLYSHRTTSNDHPVNDPQPSASPPATTAPGQPGHHNWQTQ